MAKPIRFFDSTTYAFFLSTTAPTTMLMKKEIKPIIGSIYVFRYITRCNAQK